MAIRINISDSTIENSEIMNRMTIGKNGNIDVDISDSSITGKSQVLNNISGEGNFTYRAHNVKIGENTIVMNNRQLRDGETVVINHDGTDYSKNTIRRTQTSQPQRSITKTAKKESLLKKLARIFSGKRVSKDIETVEDIVKTYRQNDHEDFLDVISGNGEYRKPEYSQINSAPENQTDEKQATKNRSSNGR